MDWLETANGIVTLISALIALIGTAVGVFFAITVDPATISIS